MEQRDEYHLANGQGPIVETINRSGPEFTVLEDTWLDKKIYGYLCK